VLNPYRYSSKRVDGADGSYDMGFRTYAPGLNSFLSRDMYNGALADLSMGTDPWNTNRYAFAGGNPISHVDLDGHLATELDSGGVSCDAQCAADLEAFIHPPAAEDDGGGVWGSVTHFVSEHKADIAGIATSIAVGVGCEVATAGAGSVGCIMAAGAAGAAVTNAMDPNADHSFGGFVKAAGFGAVTNLAGAGLGKLAGAGVRAVASKVGGKVAGRVASAASCLLSFSGATRVLMADGSTKAIKDIKVGDRVMATNPITGEHGARRVQHLWPHRDDLTRLDIDGGSVVTTEDHPYWNATDRAWEQIQDFDPGDLLLTAQGRLVAVHGLAWGTTHRAAAYNLTVAGIHTYYVVAGHHTVLVHNCGGGAKEAADLALAGGRTSGAAAELRVGGRAFTDVSTGGAERVLHPEVQAALDSVPYGMRAPWHGACAEMGCLSQAFEAGLDPAGGIMHAVAIGTSNPGHGLPKMICSSCMAVMEQFGVSGG